SDFTSTVAVGQGRVVAVVDGDRAREVGVGQGAHRPGQEQGVEALGVDDDRRVGGVVGGGGLRREELRHLAIVEEVAHQRGSEGGLAAVSAPGFLLAFSGPACSAWPARMRAWASARGRSTTSPAGWKL